MKILVVDDSVTMRNLAKRTLKSIGYFDVELCDSPLTALGMVAKSDFDLILLDWHMPKMSGLELLQKIRAQLKRSTPVIMCTVEHSKESVEQAIRAGASDYIIKPLQKHILLMKLARLHQSGTPVVAEESCRENESTVDAGNDKTITA